MVGASITYQNVGIYTAAEASRLTGVSSKHVRQWLTSYRATLRKKSFTRLWTPQLPPIKNKLALGFLDLIEVKFVGAFLERGVSWRMIHRAREKAAELYPNASHPFCTKQFVTDGQRVFAEVHRKTKDRSAQEMATDPRVFAEITKLFLKQFEFRQTALERWWPLGLERRIVVDPRRNFGQPTLANEGIPTQALAESARANGSVEAVARWYEISAEAVKEAVEYERAPAV